MLQKSQYREYASDFFLLSFFIVFPEIWQSSPPLLDNPLLQIAIDKLIEYGSVFLVILFIPYLKKGISDSFGKLQKPYDPLLLSYLKISISISIVVLTASILTKFQSIFAIKFLGVDVPSNTGWMIKYPPLFLFTIYLGLIALYEEIIFRGVIRVILERYLENKIIITLITSLIFALVHLNVSTLSAFTAFWPGLLFMILYYKTGSLLPPILAHYLYNAWLLWPEKTGGF